SSLVSCSTVMSTSTTAITTATVATSTPVMVTSLPVTVATTGHNTITTSLNTKMVISRGSTKAHMKDAIIMSLPPEDDPLLAGLQGVDTVIEHFIKNAQAQGGSNNSALLEHIEEVRRSQLAVCQTAQLVQEQVAQLVASRSQLEAHRSTLHHHLAAITSLIASSTNHSATTTAASNTIGSSHTTISNGTPISVGAPVAATQLGVTTG
ncbi:hypothetical protein OTU49_012224, partial [Cherax quadricarinatus]